MTTKSVITLDRLCATTWLLIFAIAGLLAFECIQIVVEVATVVFRHSGLAKGSIPLMPFGTCLLIAVFYMPERGFVSRLRLNTQK